MNYKQFLGFVLEQADHQPLEKKIQIYRHLAEMVGDEQEKVNLNEVADQLEKASKLCRQFVFSFNQ